MELLSQLDVASPDHVSVITRAGKVMISVKKDGAEVTVGFPIKDQVFNTTPRPPLQQPAPQLKVVEDPRDALIRSANDRQAAYEFFREQVYKDRKTTKRKSVPAGCTNRKLSDADIREIKSMLADDGIMSKFSTRSQAYEEIGKAYKVTKHAIANISTGKAWPNVN